MKHMDTSNLPAFFNELVTPPQAQTEAVLPALSRRQFFRISGIAGGGLALGLAISGSPAARAQSGGAADLSELSPYVQVKADGRINIFSKNPECGQGIKTGLPLIIAEELDVRWQDVDVVQASIDAEKYGAQFAGGSLSTPMNWMAMRQAGATARAMILAAAASQLGVPVSELTTSEGRVIHAAGNRSFAYAEFAELAATMPVPDVESLTLKDRSEFVLLGRRYTGVDNEAIVRGQPLFGIDKQLPGMVYASYTKGPVFGSRVRAFNRDHILTLDGVLDAFALEPAGDAVPFGPGSGAMFGGVAIIARSTWSALRAKQQLEVEWDNSNADTQANWERSAANAHRIALQQDGPMELKNTGDAAAAMSSAARVVEAVYEYPYIHHINLEPQNCTALYQDGRMEIWAPSQLPQQGEAGAARMLGMDPENVVLHQMRIGGGFGRRLANDYVFEVAAIARQLEGRPVKMTWSREDDMAYDYFRPGGFHGFRAAVDANGRMTAFQDHFITFTGDGENPMSSANLGTNVFPMEHVENVRITQSFERAYIPTGPFRAPGSCAFGFAFQSFLNEVAVAAGRDFRDLLLELLETEPMTPPPAPGGGGGLGGPAPAFSNERASNVIRAVTDNAGWGRSMPAGRGLGLAFYYSHMGYVAQVADVSVTAARELTVHKVWSVADFGFIHNLSAAESQIEGSILDGLSQLMYSKITFVNGEIQQANMHQYPLLRLSRAPEIEVAFLQPDVPPTGSGEPGLPPALPAIANAIYAASGERVRKLPLSELGYTLASPLAS